MTDQTTVSGSDAGRQDEQPQGHLALSTTQAVQGLDAAGRDAARHWIVHFDVMTQVRGEEPVTHKRALLVMAEDSDTAEAIARPHATLFTFGPKTLAVEWRKTSTVSLPLDVTGGAAAPHGEADDHAAITTPGATT